MTTTVKMTNRMSCIIFALAVTMATAQKRPNIILFLADDLGWADVERHDPEMRTPSLERLAARGMVLDNAYVLPVCAPTRSALLTGRYPFTYGMQVNEIKGSRIAWLNETLTLLPATLRNLGYRTHMIGKWHLGYCDWSLTPTRRGFETFYGFYSGAQGYFNHSGNNPNSYDFRDNDEVVWSAREQYSTELHTARAQRIIRQHNRESPFFLYLAYQNVHSPWETKQRYVDDYCSHVRNATRRLHCGMVAAMDESIGNITRTLDDLGYSNNTIIIFMSDNGAPIVGGSSSYPLRGKKATLWEGGTRSFTIFSAPDLRQHQGEVYSGMIHAVDWYPTLITAAGAVPPRGLDGVSVWQQLIRKEKSPRTEFIYNIDDKADRAALRWNQWKLTKGTPGRKFNGWYPPASFLEQGVPWEEVEKREIDRWQLFNLDTDPEERYNVINSSRNSQTVVTMKQKLNEYMRRLQPYKEAQKPPVGSIKRMGNANSPGWCTV